MTAHRELLASYVPVLIQRRLANDPQPVNSARLERLPASVLFADLSGFTPLTERLAQEGPAGAEELSSVVNAYFERMVDLIFAHGGDVIKFAGDATLAVWTDSDEENPDERLKALVLRAACCALEIQEKLNGYQVANDIRLHVKVGIGAGDIVVMHLGGVRDRWEILVAGDPLAQVGHAEKDARSGEVVLSPQAWQYVASCCQACLSPAGYAHLEKITAKLEPKPTTFPHLGSEADDALLGYIPGAIRSRLAAGHLRWLAELRRVSVLFVNLPGLDQTASDALAAMQHCIQSLQTAIYRYEGAINKLNVDDKGITLVAVLGLPPLTHEDDTIRAVHVALAIEKELQASHLPYAIGLATGRVYCGEIGGQKRREYTIMGDIVNLAARLMQAATNRILCDGTTQQAARARFQFERLPKLHVKGKAEAVEVFRPIEDIQSKEKHSPLVGRVVEKAQLEKALDALQNGQGGVVLIEGEAGMGKSRLLADLIDKAQRRQVSCLVGVADITERKRAYSAWRPILARVLEIDIRQETAVQRGERLAPVAKG
ncbi:MAG: hypothetical protein KatS3mg105_0144 [Gemmatales bacterium]|nr:MAG: hypothetical protein KatS3mg105_0144 [Gemmatales bacterium]